MHNTFDIDINTFDIDTVKGTSNLQGHPQLRPGGTNRGYGEREVGHAL